jgi:hypothetical protein
MDTYQLKVWGKGALLARRGDAAIHDIEDTSYVMAAATAVLGRKVKPGDSIEVWRAGRLVVRKFTVS